MSRRATVPVTSSRRSASIDFPWSMWAMIEKLRMSSRSTEGTAASYSNRASAPSARVPVPAAPPLRTGALGSAPRSVRVS